MDDFVYSYQLEDVRDDVWRLEDRIRALEDLVNELQSKTLGKEPTKETAKPNR